MESKSFASLVLALVCGGVASADDLSVPSPQYPTIQAALDAAANGDRILIAAGTFTGPGNRDIDPLGKEVQILGAGVDVTVLDPQGSPGDEHRAFWIVAGGSNLSIESLTIQGGYRDLGGALYIGGSAAPRIVGCRFTSNASSTYGGAVHVTDAAAPSLEFCVFDANGSYAGGALGVDLVAGAWVGNCTFTANSASGYGGAVSLRGDANATLQQCTLEQNQAQVSGGAIEVASSNVMLFGCTVRGNSTPGQGGGLYVADHASLTIGGGLFQGNSAWSGGAVHLWDESSANIDGATFDDNLAQNEGGGVRVDGWGSSSMNAYFIACFFTGNDAALGGGLFANDGASVQVTESHFDLNTATADGGGLYSSAAWLTVRRGSITQNTAGAFGAGALLAGGSTPATIELEDVQLVTNLAGADGGAAQVTTGVTHATFRRCEVTHNQAQQRGGALAISDASAVLIESCHVYENSALDGGALSVGNIPNVTMYDSVIEVNHAVGRGGALLVVNSGFVTAIRCTFATNDAQIGAGLAFLYGDGALRWCRILSNIAAVSGGGVALSGDAFVRVQNCQVDGNLAAEGAGLFGEHTARLVVACSTVVYNQAASTGGGIEYRTPQLILANSIVWGNAPDGLHDSGGSALVNYCDVQGGFAGGTGNIASDPLLEFVQNAWFAPAAGSPCIDAGDNARVPFEIAVDVLDRPRRIDDPWTPDTGAGTAPIVDMGLVEFRHEPVVYCQGRVNSAGCWPAINWGGIPLGWPASCGAPPFQILCSNLVNQSDGILFFGLSGRNAAAWQGGTLCVRQPIRRTPLVSSGGSPSGSDCSGSFVCDFGSVVCGDPLLAPGTTINAQWWGRDPAQPGPFKTQLSNAIEFVLN